MKRSVSLLGILCLFVSFSVQAQYTNIQTWGQKLYYNGSDYPVTHSSDNYYFSSYTLGNVYSENSACVGSESKPAIGNK